MDPFPLDPPYEVCDFLTLTVLLLINNPASPLNKIRVIHIVMATIATSQDFSDNENKKCISKYFTTIREKTASFLNSWRLDKNYRTMQIYPRLLLVHFVSLIWSLKTITLKSSLITFNQENIHLRRTKKAVEFPAMKGRRSSDFPLRNRLQMGVFNENSTLYNVWFRCQHESATVLTVFQI